MNPKRLISCLLLLCLSVLLLSACQKSPADAAERILSELSKGNKETYGLLFDSDSVTLSEQELFVLSRMTWECAETSRTDDTHAKVTVHLHTIDMMALLNEALVRSLNGEDKTFDSERWMLLQLNTGAAAKGDFEAFMPLVLDHEVWKLDPDGAEDDLDSLRDAVSGGAYSWYHIYRETFGGENPSK